MDEIVELLDTADEKIREKLKRTDLYTSEEERLTAAREDIQRAVSKLLFSLH